MREYALTAIKTAIDEPTPKLADIPTCMPVAIAGKRRVLWYDYEKIPMIFQQTSYLKNGRHRVGEVLKRMGKIYDIEFLIRIEAR